MMENSGCKSCDFEIPNLKKKNMEGEFLGVSSDLRAGPWVKFAVVFFAAVGPP